MDAIVRNPDAHTHISARKLYKQLTQQARADSPICFPWEERCQETQGSSRKQTKEELVKDWICSSPLLFPSSSFAEGSSSSRLELGVCSCIAVGSGLQAAVWKHCSGRCCQPVCEVCVSRHTPFSLHRNRGCLYIFLRDGCRPYLG